MNNKTCTKCKQEKQLIEFNKNKRQNDGFQTYCKVCQKEYIKQNKLTYNILNDDVIWLDAGTYKSLNEANNLIYNLHNK